MTFKYMIQTVIIMVIALLILSYIVDANTKYKVNKFFSEVKSKISSSVKENVEKIPTSEKIECKEKAGELVPKYLVMPDGAYNFWYDNIRIGFNDVTLRKGSAVGENINKLYFEGNLAYSKEIITNKGDILGTRSFIVKPSVERYDVGFKINHTLNFYNETREGKPWIEIRIYTDVNIFWEGFNQEVKNIFKIDELNITFIRSDIIKSFTIDKEKGERTFRHDILDWDETYTTDESYSQSLISDYINRYVYNPPPYFFSKPSVRRGLGWESFPLPIIESAVYKIVDYDILSCNWVE